MKAIGFSTIARRPFFSIGAVLAVLAAGAIPSRSAPQEGEFTYAVVFSDAQGISHFRDEHIAWNGPLFNAKTIWFRRIRAGAVRDWHNERPGRGSSKQWVIIMSGVAEYETSDGARRTFGPGSVLLVMDIGGRGHRNIIGNQDVLFATVPIPD